MTRRIFSTLILFLLLTCSSAWAGKHALLVGIAAYPKLRQLEGPPFDVGTLRDELVRHWGFPAANVTTLLDDTATRERILAELDRLRATTQPGDFIFVFYSGHGTSLYDQHLRDYGVELPAWTGALVPYDYGLGLPPRPT
ncbi:MAG: caspase family protein, partial [bacterium]|nr:caspase family protein [bacterium]